MYAYRSHKLQTLFVDNEQMKYKDLLASGSNWNKEDRGVIWTGFSLARQSNKHHSNMCNDH